MQPQLKTINSVFGRTLVTTTAHWRLCWRNVVNVCTLQVARGQECYSGHIKAIKPHLLKGDYFLCGLYMRDSVSIIFVYRVCLTIVVSDASGSWSDAFLYSILTMSYTVSLLYRYGTKGLLHCCFAVHCCPQIRLVLS